MAKVFAPNEQYNGISASVKFVNGVGETECPLLKEWFVSHGYTVEEEKVTSLDKMNKDELLKLAISLDIDVEGKTKMQLLEAIKELHKDQEIEEGNE
ncbi:hypothetical protein [Turicibacter sanguinis]|uniref:hypothetical protein n=1 Tax=Turicibacter sanguinis TaxID=154288 RepID=UPI0018ABEFE7|nr:hypothetical protein [Turicibacter sanguinis]MDB8553257.1 hypothetical protein [Turicibacter sanguinis]